MTGRFYNVGVGPGDPSLITLKALRILQSVEVIAYPVSGAERESIALSVINGLTGEAGRPLTEGKRLLPLFFPMVRDSAVMAEAHSTVAQQVYGELSVGRDVAFVTLGDPSLYSTGGYLTGYLKGMDPGVAVETVPGITSYSAAAAAAGVSLGDGNEKLAVVPATAGEEVLREVARLFENVAILKAHRQLDVLERLLDEEGFARTVLAGNVGMAGEVIEEVTGEGFLSSFALRMPYLTLILAKKGI